MDVSTAAAGVGGVMANKGAVAVSLLYEATPLCFVCSHLAARSERVKIRRDNYMKIIKGTPACVPTDNTPKPTMPLLFLLFVGVIALDWTGRAGVLACSQISNWATEA